MKKLFIITVLSLLQVLAFAQPKRKHGQGCKEDMFNVQDKQNKLWGYRNFEGDWVIPAAYQEAYPFAAGKAKVKKGAKYGMVDCSGYLIINCEYDDFMEFTGDKVWAKKGSLWGLVTEKGQLVYPPTFDEITKIGFENDVAWVRKGEKWGVFSEKALKFVVNPSYSDFTVASDQVSIVKLKDSLGLIDNYTGKYIIQPRISDMEKIGPRCFAYKMDGKWGAVNHLGENVIKSEYDHLTKWQPGLILAKKQDKFRIINEKGKSFSNTFDYIGPCVNDFAIYKFNNSFGYLDKLGNPITQPKYQEARNFYFQRAIVKINGKYQIVNTQAKFLSAITYEKIDSDSARKYFVATQASKKQILDLGGKAILSELDNVIFQDPETAIRFSKSGKYGVYNMQTNKVFVNPEYDEIQPFRGTMFLVKKNGVLGVVDKSGTATIAPQYENIDYFVIEGKLQYLVTNGGKKGIVNERNEIIIPIAYEIAAPLGNKHFVLKKDGKYGIVGQKNDEVVPFRYDYISNTIEEPNAPEQPLVYTKGKKTGFLTLKGEELIDLTGGKLKHVGEGVYAMQNDKGTVLYNKKAELVSKEVYQSVLEFSERLLPAQKTDLWGYLSVSGKFLIHPVFQEVSPYINKLAIVKKDGKYGIIDMLGREFAPFEYDSFKIEENRRLLYKGGKVYELLRSGRIKATE